MAEDAKISELNYLEGDIETYDIDLIRQYLNNQSNDYLMVISEKEKETWKIPGHLIWDSIRQASADAAGAHGVLIPKRRSCPLSATVAKTSAGAVEHVPVARIGNIVQTIKALKEEGLWVAGADMDGKNYYEADLTGPLLLVVGSEGQGIGRLVKEQCDFIVRIPMLGAINSLNASVAGSVLMFEVTKQRLSKK